MTIEFIEVFIGVKRDFRGKTALSRKSYESGPNNYLGPLKGWIPSILPINFRPPVSDGFQYHQDMTAVRGYRYQRKRCGTEAFQVLFNDIFRTFRSATSPVCSPLLFCLTVPSEIMEGVPSVSQMIVRLFRKANNK